MAKPIAGAGLLLPSSHFPADADLDAAFGFPSEFPYEFGVSSPAVESVAGSTETESSDGDEDFFAGLTRRLSQTSLHETRKQLTTTVHINDVKIPTKSQGLAGSPQSTLSGIGSWSGRSGVSGDGSPNGYSRVPSPSTTPFAESNDPWDVIYAAAGQIARLKINNQASQFNLQNNRGLLGHPRTNHNLTQVQLQVSSKQQCGSVWGRQVNPNLLVRQQPQPQVRSRGCEFGCESVKCNRSLTSPQSAWPPMQFHQHQNNRVQVNGSRSRVGVPGGSSVKRWCGGTGVFLPRHYETPSESRKKTGCAPVMLPAKVVHALNLNIDDLNATSQQRFSNAFATDYDALLARRNALLIQQRRSLRREEAANYEVRLPQDWTY